MPNEIRLDVSNPGPFAISPVRVRTNKRRSDDKDQRECNLSRHDRPSKPEAAEGRCRRAPGARRSATRGRLAGPARSRSRTPAATLTRNAKSNRRVSTADCRAFAAASRGRNAMSARMASGASSDPERSTGKREQDAVGKKLPADSPARSAQCQSCADLPVASRSARQEETRDIQAGQAQQHRRRCEQDPEWLRQPAPQSGMALRSRSEFECRREKPLPALRRDSGESGAACVLVQHRLEPGLQPCLSLRRA